MRDPTYIRLDASHDGAVWVCIQLPADVCAAIEPLFVGDTEEQTTGVGPHVTLLYLGKKSKFSAEQLKAARLTVAGVAARTEPLEFSFTGAGKFKQSKQSGGKTPIYLVPNAPGLAQMRSQILEQLRWQAGIELNSPWDFAPHVCLGYVEDPETPVPSEIPDITWTADEVSFLVNGEDETCFPLVGQPDFRKLPKSPTVVKADGPEREGEADTVFASMNRGKDVASPIPFAGGHQHGMPGKSPDGGGAPVRKDIIEKRGKKFVLKSHEGHTLGTHASEAEARSQESAINIAKARAAGHHIAKPTDAEEFQTFLTKQNVGDPDLEQEGIPERRGNKWVILKNGEVAGEYDLENEEIHLSDTFANKALRIAPEPTGSEAAAVGSEPDVKEPVPGAAKSLNKDHLRHDCKRYDVGRLDKPIKMPNGWLKCDAYLTRTGVFKYRNPDGSERLEYRPPSEVFHPTALASFQMTPVTDDHPPVFLNDSNTKKYQCGNMGERIERDDHLVRGPMMIVDGGLVKKLEDGEVDQVSCGYTCDLEDRSGVTDDGEKYDCIQRNIRGNHVAIVPVARAGEEAHVRMDSAVSTMVRIENGRGDSPSSPSEGAHVATKIKIGGKEFPAGSKEAEAALAANLKRLDSLQGEIEKASAERMDDPKDFAGAYMKKLDELKKMHDSARALHDAAFKAHELAKDTYDEAAEHMGAEYAQTKKMLEEQQAHAEEEKARADKLQKELDEAPKRIKDQLTARATLDSIARRVLGRKEKLDGLSDKEVKLKVLSKTDPDVDFKGKKDEYIDARFDVAVEDFKVEERADGILVDEEEESMPGDPHRFDGMTPEWANKEHTDRDEARAAMEYRGRTAWKQPLAPTAADLRGR